MTLLDISLDGAYKRRPSRSEAPVASSCRAGSWTASRLTGAGKSGIAIYHAANITVSGSTIEQNGSTPYDSVTNPNGDFGLRAVNVDGLTVEGSLFYDNPIVAGFLSYWSPDSPAEPNSTPTRTWSYVRTSSRATLEARSSGSTSILVGSKSSGNAIEQAVNAVSGELPNAAIHSGGELQRTWRQQHLHDNTLTGGVVATIRFFDSHR